MPDHPDAFVAPIITLILLFHLVSSAVFQGRIVVKTISLRYFVQVILPAPALDEYLGNSHSFAGLEGSSTGFAGESAGISSHTGISYSKSISSGADRLSTARPT
jgi:hypothetical protein